MASKRLFALLFVLAITGSSEIHADSDEQSCVPVGQWVIPASKQIRSSQDLVLDLPHFQVVLLGEHHDDVEHHRWQLQTISALYTLKADIVIGFEMFPRRVQDILDRWVAGELSESAFLREVGWDNYWRFDAQLYLPLFHFARLNRIPMIGLNVNRELIELSREKGWDQVPEQRRLGISTPAPPSKAYLELLAGSFRHHQEPGTVSQAPLTMEENAAFRRFVQGQQLWDRAMAEAMVQRIAQDKNITVVGVMGAGHMAHGFGVPHQLAALGMEKVQVLMPWYGESGCQDLQGNFADAVFGLESMENEGEDRPRLGVFLEQSDEEVRVSKVIEDSVAEHSGIKDGDIIIEIAGTTVTQVPQVIKVVRTMSPGTWLPITIKRGSKSIQLVAKFAPPISESEGP